MNKREFLAQLREGLSWLSQRDMEERVTFYGEMIDDRTEEGLSEEEAVNAIGSASEIVSQIIADTPLPVLVKEKIKPKRKRGAWEIVLLALGSPLWLSLLIAAFAVAFSLYVSLWAVVISLWAVAVSFFGCFIGGVVAGIAYICCGNTLSGFAMLATGVVCAGFAIFVFCACRVSTKGVVMLTKELCFAIKRCFIGKGVAV